MRRRPCHFRKPLFFTTHSHKLRPHTSRSPKCFFFLGLTRQLTVNGFSHNSFRLSSTGWLGRKLRYQQSDRCRRSSANGLKHCGPMYFCNKITMVTKAPWVAVRVIQREIGLSGDSNGNPVGRPGGGGTRGKLKRKWNQQYIKWLAVLPNGWDLLGSWPEVTSVI